MHTAAMRWESRSQVLFFLGAGRLVVVGVCRRRQYGSRFCAVRRCLQCRFGVWFFVAGLDRRWERHFSSGTLSVLGGAVWRLLAIGHHFVFRVVFLGSSRTGIDEQVSGPEEWVIRGRHLGRVVGFFEAWLVCGIERRF